jgi:hypothetical protein
VKGERRLKRQAKKKMRSELLAELISRTTWRHVAGAPILRFHFARISFHSQNWLKPSSFFFLFFFFRPWRNRWCVCVCIFHIKQSPIVLAAWNFFSSWKEKLVIIDWWRNIKKGKKKTVCASQKSNKMKTRRCKCSRVYDSISRADVSHRDLTGQQPLFFLFLIILVVPGTKSLPELSFPDSFLQALRMLPQWS